jgi:hypothetical protein
MLIMVYPAAGFGIVEDLYALLAAGVPDTTTIGALFAKYNFALIRP